MIRETGGFMIILPGPLTLHISRVNEQLPVGPRSVSMHVLSR